jgi:hypothetical protein
MFRELEFPLERISITIFLDKKEAYIGIDKDQIDIINNDNKKLYRIPYSSRGCIGFDYDEEILLIPERFSTEIYLMLTKKQIDLITDDMFDYIIDYSNNEYSK